ncbi:PAS domain S-box protein [Methylocaldum sp.]|uniref:PAS domain S-box protein n=1 Tax=Methylocaldum sp. TaxID=1969727 RepID=UPI002D5F234D|nr:PAS domain S-box protein [Methylocaldum sp.]HYE36406.1 PAS domain S-box protein [Methylocaldum sp.]
MSEFKSIDRFTRTLLDGFDDAVCMLDDAGRLIFMNRAAERLFGYSEEELRGRPVFSELEVRAESMPLRWGRKSPSIAQERFFHADETRFRRKDGTVFAARYRLTPLKEGDVRLHLLHLTCTGPHVISDTALDTESNLKAILDTISDGVIVIDEVGIIQLLNPAAERLFGYKREELIGENVKRLMPSPYREEHDGYLANYRKTGIRKIIGTGREVAGQRKDGSVFPMYLSIGELRQANRRLFVGITHDLTRRKQNEEYLSILSGAVEQSPNAIMIADLEGRITFVNRAFCRLTGYSIDEVIGQNPRLLQSGQTPPGIYRRLWEMIQAGNEWQGEIQDRKKSGELYWALETITPICDGAGKIARYLATQRDITEQKRNKEALQESEERFRQVAEMVGEWLWEQDSEGRYVYSSGSVYAILGLKPEEIIGKRYLDLLTPEDRQHWTGTLPPTKRVHESFYKLINHYRHRDGHEVFTESTGAPIFDEQGRVIKWRGMDLDITARKRFEDTLRLRERAIEAASVGIVIADARQPHYPNIYVNPALSRITGYSQEDLLGRNLKILQGPETEETAKEEIREALQQGTSCEVVLRNYRKDGTPFWNELLLSPVRDNQGTVTHYIGIQTDVTERRRAEEERHELEIAKHIQLSLLPKKPLNLPGAEIAGVCVPATHVGGDYFDYFHYDDNADIVIADVSGHSVGAALIMTEMRSTLKAETRKTPDNPSPQSTAEVLRALNQLLYEDLSAAELFITMFYVKYDLEKRVLRYANAGHNRALLLRQSDWICSELDADGLILGVKRDVIFEEKTLILEPGDRLLLYTDGVIEAQNEQGEFFGISRLCNVFSADRSESPETTIGKLLDELRAFCGKSEFEDDITMVILQVR